MLFLVTLGASGQLRTCASQRDEYVLNPSNCCANASSYLSPVKPSSASSWIHKNVFTETYADGSTRDGYTIETRYYRLRITRDEYTLILMYDNGKTRERNMGDKTQSEFTILTDLSSTDLNNAHVQQMVATTGCVNKEQYDDNTVYYVACDYHDSSQRVSLKFDYGEFVRERTTTRVDCLSGIEGISVLTGQVYYDEVVEIADATHIYLYIDERTSGVGDLVQYTFSSDKIAQEAFTFSSDGTLSMKRVVYAFSSGIYLHRSVDSYRGTCHLIDNVPINICDGVSSCISAADILNDESSKYKCDVFGEVNYGGKVFHKLTIYFHPTKAAIVIDTELNNKVVKTAVKSEGCN